MREYVDELRSIHDRGEEQFSSQDATQLEEVRGSLEEAVRERNRLAEELLEVNADNWGLVREARYYLEEAVRERNRLAEELLEVNADNKTLSNLGKSALYYLEEA